MTQAHGKAGARRTRLKGAAARAREHMANQAANRAKLAKPTEWSRLVNGMDNGRRHAWARAGYPGLRQKEIEKLRPFTRPTVRSAA